MERLARQKKNFRILRIDIGKWDSDVARQYGVVVLPTLWLYEGKELRADTRGEVLTFLQRG